MISLSMVVPALNEEELVDEFMEKSVQDLQAVTDDWEIVFVDDGSTDGTLELAQAWADRYEQIQVVSLGRNLGNGANVEVGFRHATKEVVFNNTVDAFFNTEDLEWIVPHLEKYDAISGYRSDLSANNIYQKLLTLGNLAANLLESLKLPAFGRLILTHSTDLSGMIANLLEPHERLHHDSPPGHSVGSL